MIARRFLSPSSGELAVSGTKFPARLVGTSPYPGDMVFLAEGGGPGMAERETSGAHKRREPPRPDQSRSAYSTLPPARWTGTKSVPNRASPVTRGSRPRGSSGASTWVKPLSRNRRRISSYYPPERTSAASKLVPGNASGTSRKYDSLSSRLKIRTAPRATIKSRSCARTAARVSPRRPRRGTRIPTHGAARRIGR